MPPVVEEPVAGAVPWLLVPKPSVQRSSRVRQSGPAGPWSYSRQSNLAGTENGLPASTRNMISACNGVVPALNTSIVVCATCPFMV